MEHLSSNPCAPRVHAGLASSNIGSLGDKPSRRKVLSDCQQDSTQYQTFVSNDSHN